MSGNGTASTTHGGGLGWLLCHYYQLNKTLRGFRRHPDWQTAFGRMLEKRNDLIVTLEDGRKALSDENAAQILEAADDEFIEELIRRGY
jgi:hypothetical protein